ncbi:MAG: thioredoxin family protein [Gammaproteobacteria bacterium]|nr:thioredoxin family protein [Gammaproteobacteria bacterium]NNM12688.1 hypothetical protein [Gammaproteobacteria bacterium]
MKNTFRPFVKLFITIMMLNFAFSSQAAIDYTDWTPDSMSDLLHQAKDKKRKVLVVVTQPDWCPPCIRLENRIIKNPDETEFANLAKNWMAFEILGYDQAGAEFLANQELKFHGTPTVFLLDPSQLDTKNKAKHARAKLKNKTSELKLGDLKVMHSIAGDPDDFTAQFAKAISGFDAIAEAQKMVRAEQTLEAYRALATAYVDQGKAKQAKRVYQSMLFRDDLLEEEIQDIKWEQIFQVTQRVVKDHAATVKAIDKFVEQYPDFIKDKSNFESYAYRRAWSLVELDRVDEANAVLKQAYVEPNDIEGLTTYLYFAFRNPKPELLMDAKKVCDQALKEFPESEARLKAAEGRLFRRLGNLEAAKASFSRAIELLDPENEDDATSIEVYQGQLEYIEAQMTKS